MQSHFIHNLEALKAQNNFRSIPEYRSNLIDLSANDYLGLTQDADFEQEFWERLMSRKPDFGGLSSRLLLNKAFTHQKVEEKLAQMYQNEAALLFNSGYHTNMGIIPALSDGKDLIVADKFIHASLIDGCRLSKADFVRYKHLDLQHLEIILKAKRNRYRNCFILSESIFSMDGDRADLQELIRLKKEYNCFLYLDEAHAVGVLGKQGLGLAEEQNCVSEIDFLVGTFGKALASYGAFVVCNQMFKDYLINYSRSLIYSTALPEAQVLRTLFVLEKLHDLQYKREKLAQLVSDFEKETRLENLSHIIPIICGENEKALQLSAKLEEMGYKALAIRYPTVPNHTARIRLSLNAGLNREQLAPIIKMINNEA